MQNTKDGTVSEDSDMLGVIWLVAKYVHTWAAHPHST